MRPPGQYPAGTDTIDSTRHGSTTHSGDENLKFWLPTSITDLPSGVFPTVLRKILDPSRPFDYLDLTDEFFSFKNLS